MFELMIVDDEQSVVDGIAGTLPWKEMQIDAVHKAYSGQEAFDILSRCSIDIVITDIRMPEITGIDLIKRIREQWPRTKTILLSGHSEFEYAKEAIRHSSSDYLLKPVRDEDLRASITGVIEQISKEWAEVASYQRTIRTLRENLPLLRSNLLNEMLEGRRSASAELVEKMKLMDIQLKHGDEIAVLLIRLEEEFANYDLQSLSLFEYAIGNMAEELFQNDFRLWMTKDRHDYLVFLMQAVGNSKETHMKLENMAAQLQKNVSTYLKGTISIVASPWGRFPEEINVLYESSVASLRRRVGMEREFFLALRSNEDVGTVNALHSLYEPPMLMHLMEAGRWQAAEQKAEHILNELEERFPGSLEHLMEVFFSIASAMSYIAHKNGRRLEDLIGHDFEMFTRAGALRSAHQLRDWTQSAIERIRLDMENEVKDTRSGLVKQVQEYVERHLSGDLSLHAIADHVHLHPVYLSRVYKLETGEVLSDYLFRYRMDKAVYLLKNSNDRVYEVAEQLGYTNPPYFIKVFKKEFGMTPQEYRDSK